MNLEKLKGHIPDSVIAQIPSIETKFEINTPLRLAHFLAQCGHESGGFKVLRENLNYGAKGLRSIFGKYFPTDALALAYERKPEKNLNSINRINNNRRRDNTTIKTSQKRRRRRNNKPSTKKHRSRNRTL